MKQYVAEWGNRNGKESTFPRVSGKVFFGRDPASRRAWTYFLASESAISGIKVRNQKKQGGMGRRQ